MWVILGICITTIIAGAFVVKYLIPNETWQILTIIIICIVFLVPCFYALKLEISIGSYKCKNCGYEIIPSYKQALSSLHKGTTRFLKCPKCNKRTWCKKVLDK